MSHRFLLQEERGITTCLIFVSIGIATFASLARSNIAATAHISSQFLICPVRVTVMLPSRRMREMLGLRRYWKRMTGSFLSAWQGPQRHMQSENALNVRTSKPVKPGLCDFWTWGKTFKSLPIFQIHDLLSNMIYLQEVPMLGHRFVTSKIRRGPVAAWGERNRHGKLMGQSG